LLLQLNPGLVAAADVSSCSIYPYNTTTAADVIATDRLGFLPAVGVPGIDLLLL